MSGGALAAPAARRLRWPAIVAASCFGINEREMIPAQNGVPRGLRTRSDWCPKSSALRAPQLHEAHPNAPRQQNDDQVTWMGHIHLTAAAPDCVSLRDASGPPP